MGLFKRVYRKIVQIANKNDIDELKMIAAEMLVRDNKNRTFQSLQDAEFKVFSQWGEDGIIQYLINRLPIENKTFIEFGVEDYTEANTRFLLMHDNWSGLVIDGGPHNIRSINSSDLYWKYDLVAKSLFITRENIDPTIKEYVTTSGGSREIGLLSIDIDGNDYHVWDAIVSIDPVIVVCEYNWIFGNRDSVTVPYDKDFFRTDKHHSNLYFGASIQALYQLAKSKGYEYIGCTKMGNDAFFVKREYAREHLEALITTPDVTFEEQKAKESRDEEGRLTFVRGKERLKIIESMEVLNLDDGQLVRLGNLFDQKEV